MKTERRSNVKAVAKPKIKIEKGSSNAISKAKNQRPQLTPKRKPKIEKILSDDRSSAMYNVKKENIKSTATARANVQVPTRNGASANRVQRIHLEYLTIMQKYYKEQYGNLSAKFYAKFGQRGEKAKTPQAKSTFEHFQAERNNLFQGSQYEHVRALIDRVNTSDGSGMDELYRLTEKHQQGMRRTLGNLESMYFFAQ